MRQAACSGDRASMIFLAKAYDTGFNVRLVFSPLILCTHIFILKLLFLWRIFYYLFKTRSFLSKKKKKISLLLLNSQLVHYLEINKQV